MSHESLKVLESSQENQGLEGPTSATPGMMPREPGFANDKPLTGVATSDGAAPFAAPDGALPPLERRASTVPFSGEERRKSGVERRAGLERRVIDIGSPTGLERRRGPGRRRTDDRRSAEEGEMTDEQFEFVLAVDTYKRLNNRPFPSWTEVLEIVKQLGYRKVAASTLTLSGATGRSASVPAPLAPPLPPARPEKESEFMPG